MSGLPSGWHQTTLGDIGLVQSGVGFPNELQGMPSGDFPVYKVGDVSRGVLQAKGCLRSAANYVSRETAASMKGYVFPVGATVFAKIGEALKLNRRGFVLCEGLADNNVMGFKAEQGISDRFVYYFLLTQDLAAFSRSTTVPSIRKGDVEGVEIPLPPLAEQTRIAARLDELLAQVDTLKARIDGIPALLKRFRQSVLAAAVSGRLTEEWRVSAQLTPVQALLDVIALERSELKARKLLKASFGRFDAVDALYPLPCTSWEWACFDQISRNDNNALKAGPFGSALKKSDCVPAGYKVYGQEQVIAGDERLVTYFIDADKFEELEACRVGSGDILISLVGTIGKVLVLSESAEVGIINPRLVKISVHPDVSREYLKLYLDSGVAHGFFKRFSHGGTMEILNLGILKELPIPLPSIAEQTEIVRRVEQLFAFADQLEARVNEARSRIDRLTQSILAKAFRGELVPQDPNDEPASALLQRIQAQRAAAPRPGRGRNKASSA